jgi:hypothetical protein
MMLKVDPTREPRHDLYEGWSRDDHAHRRELLSPEKALRRQAWAVGLTWLFIILVALLCMWLGVR